MDCKNDNTVLKIKAVKKESTRKPPTILAHKRIKIALITNRNNPKVKIVTGSVKRTSMGLTNTFSNPKTIATIIDVVKLSTSTPFMKWESNITNIELKTIFINSFMTFFFNNNNKFNT
jgi:hypothetical protein